jgi:ABC-2 type transport system permease protein
VVAGKSVANTVLSLSSMVFGYVLVSLLFGFKLTITNPPAFLASLVLALFSLIAMGLLIAAFMSLNIGATVWVNALEFPMYILGGFLFPIALLPDWVTPLSYLLAPYWAARALHGTSSGAAPLGDVLLSWGMLIFFSVVYLFVSRWLFEKLLHRARVDATLGLQ